MIDYLKDNNQSSIDELNSFKTIYEFLIQHPGSATWKKKINLDLYNPEQVDALFKKYVSGKSFKLSQPRTIIDKAVKTVLVYAYNFDISTVDELLLNHQYSMLAENQIGDLLEKYLASRLEPLGWVWCSGSIVNKIDFIKYDGKEWVLLQIKNRESTENSSSSAIRNNTNIIKWFRLSNKGVYCWNKFPESQSTGLNEDDFLKFVEEESSRLKIKV